MQFDKVRIAIRQRNVSDILDLSLHVLRSHAGPLLVALAALAFPLSALNYWLATSISPSSGGRAMLCLLLTFFEVPLATAPITLYLGQALFLERPRFSQIGLELLKSLSQLFLFQVLIRGVLTLGIASLIVPYAAWPYLNEVILLERNPVSARRLGELSTMRRSMALHTGTGTLLLQAGSTGLLALILVFAIQSAANFLICMLIGSTELDESARLVLWQSTLWLVAAYLTVFRFLSYLDLRIRREGWEVELYLRAEGARLARQMT